MREAQAQLPSQAAGGAEVHALGGGPQQPSRCPAPPAQPRSPSLLMSKAQGGGCLGGRGQGDSAYTCWRPNSAWPTSLSRPHNHHGLEWLLVGAGQYSWVRRPGTTSGIRLIGPQLVVRAHLLGTASGFPTQAAEPLDGGTAQGFPVSPSSCVASSGTEVSRGPHPTAW